VGRKGLSQSLAKQASPLVQISILDEIVEVRDRSAVPAIRDLAAKPDVNPEVKQHAQWALRQLQ
jgi:hypothetical protein